MGTNSWQTLNTLSANGQLELDPSVRADCAKACDDLINGLVQVKDKLRGVNFKFDLGDFNCPAPLIDAIENTATGEDGFFGRLTQHIEIVQEIKATMLRQVRQLQGQDDANSGAVQNAAQPNVVAPPTPQQADQTALNDATTQAIVNNTLEQMRIDSYENPF